MGGPANSCRLSSPPPGLQPPLPVHLPPSAPGASPPIRGDFCFSFFLPTPFPKDPSGVPSHCSVGVSSFPLISATRPSPSARGPSQCFLGVRLSPLFLFFFSLHLKPERWAERLKRRGGARQGVAVRSSPTGGGSTHMWCFLFLLCNVVILYNKTTSWGLRIVL